MPRGPSKREATARRPPDESRDHYIAAEVEDDEEIVEGNGLQGSRMQGVNGDALYYGRVSKVTSRPGGRNLYYVLWDANRYDEGKYEYSMIRQMHHTARYEPASVTEAATPQGAMAREACEEITQHERRDESKFHFHFDYGRSGMLLKGTNWCFEKDKKGRTQKTAYGRTEAGDTLFCVEHYSDETDDDDIGSDDDGSDDSEDDAPISSWGDRAVSYLSTSLRKNTQSSYATATRAWERYLALQSFEIRLGWDPAIDDHITKSIEAEKLFMGFVFFLVKYQGVTVETAATYKTNAKSQIQTKTGADMCYGLQRGRMKKLIQRLKIKYPHKRKPRLPFLQQELLGSREIIRRYEQGRSAPKISRELGLKEEAVSALCKVLDLYGSKLCWAVLTCVCFQCEQSGRSSPTESIRFRSGSRQHSRRCRMGSLWG